MNGRVRVKICGVTQPEDAALAIELGADAIGLNFAPESPRCINLDQARAILDVLPPLVEAVAVFVSRTSAQMLDEIAALPRIRTVQLHGRLDEDENPLGRRLIRAFAVRGADDLSAIEQYLERLDEQRPGAVLLDGHAAGLHGGTGRTAPWHLLADFRPGVPVILAGGLNPDNVAEAVRRVRPYAVDVASGVECRPGLKDADKLRRFIEAATSADAASFATIDPR